MERTEDSSLARARARIEELEEEVAHLRTALESRPPIEHVVGMLMLTMSCGPQTAWATLTHLSQTTNRKVRDLAAVIAQRVECGEGLPAELAATLRDAMPPATHR